MAAEGIFGSVVCDGVIFQSNRQPMYWTLVDDQPTWSECSSWQCSGTDRKSWCSFGAREHVAWVTPTQAVKEMNILLWARSLFSQRCWSWWEGGSQSVEDPHVITTLSLEIETPRRTLLILENLLPQGLTPSCSIPNKPDSHFTCTLSYFS